MLLYSALRYLALYSVYLILLSSIHGATTHYRLPPPHSPAHVRKSSPGCVKFSFLGSISIRTHTLESFFFFFSSFFRGDARQAYERPARCQRKENRKRLGRVAVLLCFGRVST
ncbi:hypothetical protein V8C34DRAFT_267175, partial [Trichoderma compactum]